MKILALELSTARGSIAWLESNVDRSLREWPNDRKHSGLFFENLRDITKQFGAAEKIIVGLGPGSYAGTRIAISAAIGLQAVSNSRLLGLASICAMESNNEEYCVIGDARRQSFFFAHVRKHELIEGPILFGETELKSKLAEFDEGTPIFSSDNLTRFERVVLRYPSALLLAQLGQDEKRSFSLPPLEPIYLREPHITAPRSVVKSTIAR